MTVGLIRKTLWSLYFRRKHTIKRLREGGRNMRRETEALEALRVQLEVSAQWSLKQHISMVIGLREHIHTLLKTSFYKDSKVSTLLTDCQSMYNQPTLF